MMCISLFSYGRPVVVRCMGVRLGMGWVGHGSISSPGSGLGWVSYLVGWVGSMKIDPRTTLIARRAENWRRHWDPVHCGEKGG